MLSSNSCQMSLGPELFSGSLGRFRAAVSRNSPAEFLSVSNSPLSCSNSCKRRACRLDAQHTTCASKI